jgi:Cu-Zn family superoxide dismutase
MSIRSAAAVVLLALPLLAGAAGGAARAPSARAVLLDAAGQKVGTAVLLPARSGVTVRVEVKGLPPGKHGIHLHAAGRCEAPDFKTAGGHFNPMGKQHGLHNPSGAHAGDLPNLVVAGSGKGWGTFTARGVTLGDGEGSLLAGDGTAIVIHADADDEQTDPSGNSGARIACGVVERR